ncbi:MAG: ABC transporter ATP-binding protein [Fretibacterium sp.]|nr:ABC transporter ATP-binding protein [Fretibacterium sp.]
MSAIFSIEDMCVSYGREKIIHGVSLSIGAGELCALLGLNGSGKTTILHAACGFLPMTGVCTAAGQDCSGLNEKKRARLISFIPQVCSMRGGITVMEAVLMGFNAHLGLFGSPSRAQKQFALDTLERLGYASFKGRDFGTLSQGQKQIVLLARCLVQNAPVMLMDEPDNALDFLNRHMVLQKIREVLRTQQKAGLITLHDPNFAMNYCDRLLLLKSGYLVGEIKMKGASREELEKKLSLIYGAIEVFSFNGNFFMGQVQETETSPLFTKLC